MNRENFSSAISTQNPSKEGIIIIPGLGSLQRIPYVLKNLKNLQNVLNRATQQWDCSIVIYAHDNDKKFWKRGHNDIETIRSSCNITLNPGGYYTQNIHTFNPKDLRNIYKYVFILLDDVNLGNYNTKFNLSYMLDIFRFNNATMASPRIIRSSMGSPGDGRQFMTLPAKEGTAGYIVRYIEIYACLFTMTAYEAFWELISPITNIYGWGQDVWYDGYARQIKAIPNHKMCIISIQTAIHAIGNRTKNADKTSRILKIKAFRAQEDYFLNKYNINLYELSVEDKEYSRSNRMIVGSIQSGSIGLLDMPP
eukprot:gene5701-11495_t